MTRHRGLACGDGRRQNRGLSSARNLGREKRRVPESKEARLIKGMHAMFYTTEAEELRRFLRDKLELRCADAGDGWLIFQTAESELGCHPAEPGKSAPAGTHDVSFYCEDVQATVQELQARGVEFEGGIEDHGYGLVTRFRMPGGVSAQLYQPRYSLKFR
jgi:hypothetical protein